MNPSWIYMVGDDTRTMALDCNFTGFQVCGLEVLGSGTWSPDPTAWFNPSSLGFDCCVTHIFLSKNQGCQLIIRMIWTYIIYLIIGFVIWLELIGATFVGLPNTKPGSLC